MYMCVYIYMYTYIYITHTSTETEAHASYHIYGFSSDGSIYRELCRTNIKQAHTHTHTHTQTCVYHVYRYAYRYRCKYIHIDTRHTNRHTDIDGSYFHGIRAHMFHSRIHMIHCANVSWGISFTALQGEDDKQTHADTDRDTRHAHVRVRVCAHSLTRVHIHTHAIWISSFILFKYVLRRKRGSAWIPACVYVSYVCIHGNRCASEGW